MAPTVEAIVVERWTVKVVTVNVIVVAETATAASDLEVVAVNMMMKNRFRLRMRLHVEQRNLLRNNQLPLTAAGKLCMLER